MNKIRNDYLKENEQYLTNLKNGLNNLKEISNQLLSYNINIETKPWYKNLVEIYIPKTFDFYNNCKNDNFDIDTANDIWMRIEYKSFLSEVEKFTKFIIKSILKVEGINFNGAINKLENVILEYKSLFEPEWEPQILEIKTNLHRWRKNYNENKHDEEKMDDSFYIEDRTLTSIGSDILEYISDFICYIVCPLLVTLLIITKNKLL